MTKRGVLWMAVVALAGAATVAVLLPPSPAYLGKFFGPDGGYYEGRPGRHWIKALDNPDAATRLEAIKAVSAIGPEADRAVPALARIVADDPDRAARIEAARALSGMGPAAAAAVPALAKGLEDEEPFVRMNAAVALTRLRAEAKPAVPALLRALKEESNQTNLGSFTTTIQETVAVALGYASAGTPEAVPALIEALEAAKRDETRMHVARALGEVGLEARPAVPKLKALLRHSTKEVRENAAEALQKIEGGSAAAP